MQTANLNLTQQDVQIMGAILAACKQGMQAELATGKCPAPRAAFLAEAIGVCDKFLMASAGAQPQAGPEIIMPQNGGK